MTAATSPSAHRTGCSVLVVDDDKMNRIMLSKLLEHEGYEAKVVVNGREALDAIAAERFDAVLLDILMPEVDGFEVLQKVKYDSRLWHIPVIMISSVEERESIVRCLEIGADDYVVKPFDPVLLRARINACLARRRFRDLEVEYQKVVAEQLDELDDLNRGVSLGRLRRFVSPAAAEQLLASSAPLPGDAHAGLVAVVACELSGLGDAAGSAGPETTWHILRAFYDLVGDLADRFDATVVSVARGSVTVVFNDPLPCADPAAAALRMTEALDENITPALGAWTAETRAPLGWRAAACLGDAVLGQAGFGGRWDYEAVGPVIDRAHELCRSAPDGTTVLDDAVRDASPGMAM